MRSSKVNHFEEIRLQNIYTKKYISSLYFGNKRNKNRCKNLITLLNQKVVKVLPF